MRNTGPRLLLVGVVMSVLLVACGDDSETTTGATGSETGSAAAPATLRVALDWFPNPDHVALYYAQDNGFFEEQNLTVEFKTPSDVTAGLKLVARTQFDLSIFYQGDMFFAAQEGLPVIAVGSLIPQPLNSLMALSDSKVQGVDSVKGATIGVAGLPFDDAILDTIRQSQGLSEDDVKSVNVGFDLVPALGLRKRDGIQDLVDEVRAPVLAHQHEPDDRHSQNRHRDDRKQDVVRDRRRVLGAVVTIEADEALLREHPDRLEHLAAL